MTKEEYIRWNETKGPDTELWSIAECCEADILIRNTALTNARLALRAKGIEPFIREYIELHLRCSYGSVETDRFLMRLNAYPNWM